MSDNIWRERFWERNNAGQDDFAWHHLGKRGDPSRKVPVRVALREADIDYGVVTRPLWYVSPDGGNVMSDHVAIIRPAWNGEPEALYGVATAGYTPIQNGEIAELLEPLAERWPVETIGAIRKGADMFVTLDAGRRKIGKDEIRQFFFVWNSHDGSSALRVRITPIRVVCQNTCILGDARSTVALDVRHTQRVLAEAQFAFNLVAQIRQAEENTMAALERLLHIRLSSAQVSDIFDLAYPVREPSALLARLEASKDNLTEEQTLRMTALARQLEADRETAKKRKLLALQRLGFFNNDFPSMAMTGWAAYNAITEVETWRAGGTNEQAAMSILMGDRGNTMARTYNAIAALA